LEDEYGFTKGYDAVRRYIKKNCAQPVKAYGVQITKPGEEAEVDFGYLGKLPGLDGIPTKTWGLVATLSFSRLSYYAIVYNQKLDTLVKQLEKAFNFFGGVPYRLKIDNMKTAVYANKKYTLEFNRDFLEFCYHYGVTIKPCTPFHPEQKGKVEAGVKYLQNNFVAGREFVDEKDIKGQLANWTSTYANQRKHGTTRKIPNEVFAEEKKSMQPLPTEKYAFFQREQRKVQKNCHVHFQNNYYSAPAHLVDIEVTIRWDEHLVRIVHEGEQVALHKRSPGKGEYTTVRSHLPDYKVYSETEYQARYEKRMSQIGVNAHAYFHHLLLNRSKCWARIVRGVLGLVESYGQQNVDLGLKRALYYNVLDLSTIKNIMKKRLYSQEQEPLLLSVPTTYQMSRKLDYYTDEGRVV
jgi:transposase